MISDAAIHTIHNACWTDRLYAVTRRDGLTWIMEGGSIKEVNFQATSIWEQTPLSVTPILGVLPLPRVEI